MHHLLWSAVPLSSPSLSPRHRSGSSRWSGSGLVTGQCPLWVKSRHRSTSASCPLYPRKRTFVERVRMSALCQKRTHALQQTVSLFDHVIGALPQEQRHVEAERLSAFQIDHQLELVRSLDGELARFCALEDAVTIGCCTLELAERINAVGYQAAGFGEVSK